MSKESLIEKGVGGGGRFTTLQSFHYDNWKLTEIFLICRRN